MTLLLIGKSLNVITGCPDLRPRFQEHLWFIVQQKRQRIPQQLDRRVTQFISRSASAKLAQLGRFKNRELTCPGSGMVPKRQGTGAVQKLALVTVLSVRAKRHGVRQSSGALQCITLRAIWGRKQPRMMGFMIEKHRLGGSAE